MRRLWPRHSRQRCFSLRLAVLLACLCHGGLLAQKQECSNYRKDADIFLPQRALDRGSTYYVRSFTSTPACVLASAASL